MLTWLVFRLDDRYCVLLEINIHEIVMRVTEWFYQGMHIICMVIYN